MMPAVITTSQTFAPMGGGTGSVYAILPHFALMLGVICVVSYVSTRLLKKVL